MKKWFLATFAVISVLVAFFTEPLISNVKMDNLIDYAMDFNNNFCFLNYNIDDLHYYLKRTDHKGNLDFSLKLDNGDNDTRRNYKQLDIDAQGNIYILYEDREIINLPDEATQIGGIKKEAVIVYSGTGVYIKDLATVDFSGQEELPQKAYIYGIQGLEQEVNIICGKENVFEVLNANVIEEKKPELKQKFEIPSEITASPDLISDIAISNTGKVVYSTRTGGVFAMNNGGKFVSIMPDTAKEMVASDLSIDFNDNVFFTDLLSGNFYKLTATDLKLTPIYTSKSVLNQANNIKFEDVSRMFVNGKGDYFAKYKNTENDKYLFMGAQEGMTQNVSHNIFPFRVIVFGIITVLTFAVLIGILLLVLKFKKRVTVNSKMMLALMPLYILAMLILIFYVVKTFMVGYDIYLKGEQEVCSNIILNEVDGDLYANVDPVYGYLTNQYNTLTEQINTGLESAQSVGNKPSQYVIAYKMKDNKLYTFIQEGRFESEIKVRFGSSAAIAKPVEYLKSKESTEIYYEMWNTVISGKSNDRDIIYTTVGENGKGISVFKAVTDSDGNIVGMLQSSVDKDENVNKYLMNTIIRLIILFTLATVILFVSYSLIVRTILKPLKKINKSVNAIGEGIWDTKLKIKTRDEFSDIARAFNIMTDRMNQYISNLVVLNREYIKFVPMELIHLLGKKQITDVRLNDRNNIETSVVYVNFDREYNGIYQEVSEDKYFDMMNENFDRLFTVVENNNGIIQWFDGLGMVVLFPQNSEDAIKTSMQFKEVFAGETLGKRMRILLSKGNAIIGITGNSKRHSISVVSDEIMHMDYLIKRLNKINVKHFALEPIIKEICNGTKYSYRFIGQIKNISTNKPVKLYEFIDNINVYEKNLYISTRPLFEKAVETYIKGDFAEARKLFTNVLRINEEDKLAMHYLLLCDKNNDTDLKNWNGYL